MTKLPGVVLTLVLTLIFTSASCTTSTAISTNERADASWGQYANVEEAGFDAAALVEARAHADQAKSAAVFVVADGHVVAAWGAVDRKLELHSVRKSLYAALWGIAEARGLVDLNTTLEELGIDDLHPLTAAEKKARLIDLLHARSGVYHPAAYAPSDQDKTRPERGSHPPDTFWFYNNWDFNVAGALLERVGGQPLGTLFDEWIAKPVGMEDYRPDDVSTVLEPGVSKWPALTVRMSARDLARFGLLWLNRGAWNGRQIVPAGWVERAEVAASNTGAPGQGYGMMWWIYEAGSVDAQRYPNASPVRILLARGTGGQTIAVVPEANVMIVHRGDTDNSRMVSGRDVWTLIDRILGARKSHAVQTNPTLAAVRVEPFASQLPPFAWPSPVTLDAAAIRPLLGEYQLRPGMVARVFLHEERLYASMPGRGEAELFALSPTEFFVRVDPSARIRFEDDAVRVTIDGRELVAVRK